LSLNTTSPLLGPRRRLLVDLPWRQDSSAGFQWIRQDDHPLSPPRPPSPVIRHASEQPTHLFQTSTRDPYAVPASMDRTYVTRDFCRVPQKHAVDGWGSYWVGIRRRLFPTRVHARTGQTDKIPATTFRWTTRRTRSVRIGQTSFSQSDRRRLDLRLRILPFPG
jgi:hypothetical protein